MNPIIGDICKALGLKRVRKLVLTLEVKQAVKVDVERFVTDEELGNLKLVFERYNIELRPDTEDVTAIGEEFERRQVIRRNNADVPAEDATAPLG